MSDHEVTILYHRLHVVRAAVEHSQKDTALHALNLIELQLVRLLSSPEPAITLVTLPVVSEA